MFDGSVSKIHVFLDLDVYSSSRTIKRKESCTGTRDEKLNCYKNKRNNNIEQIRMELNSLSSPVSNPHLILHSQTTSLRNIHTFLRDLQIYDLMECFY